MTTITDTAADRIQALGATLRTCGRIGRHPTEEELQRWGDALFTLAAEVRALQAGLLAADELREIEARAAAARMQ
jgi:hypothetical protein